MSQMDQNSVLSSKSSWGETFGLCGGWGALDAQPHGGLECESSPQTSGKGTRTWLGQHVSARARPGLQEAMLGRTTGSLTLLQETQQDMRAFRVARGPLVRLISSGDILFDIGIDC